MPRIATCFSLVLLWTSAVAAQPIIRLNPESTRIQIDSIEPGGGVALLGIHRRLEGYTTVAGGLHKVMLDEDGDGLVSTELEIQVPKASVWVAVDLTRGAVDVAWPEGFEPISLNPSNLRLGGPGGVEGFGETLEMSGRLLEVFVVRPGDGAAVWHQTLANGGPMDADPDPASMSLRLDSLDALTEDGTEASPSPTSLGPEDLVILLDPTRLRWRIVRGHTLLDGLEGDDEATGKAVAGGGR